jgi:hypothetical protein
VLYIEWNGSEENGNVMSEVEEDECGDSETVQLREIESDMFVY